MEETEFGRSTLEKREEEERKEQIQFQFSVSESVFILLWINKVFKLTEAPIQSQHGAVAVEEPHAVGHGHRRLHRRLHRRRRRPFAGRSGEGFSPPPGERGATTIGATDERGGEAAGQERGGRGLRGQVFHRTLPVAHRILLVARRPPSLETPSLLSIGTAAESVSHCSGRTAPQPVSARGSATADFEDKFYRILPEIFAVAAVVEDQVSIEFALAASQTYVLAAARGELLSAAHCCRR